MADSSDGGPNENLIVVRDHGPSVWVAIGGLLVLIFLFGVIGAVGVSVNSSRITEQEKKDRADLRAAAARNCARDNLTRAEVHLAYQQAAPTPDDGGNLDPEKVRLEPILIDLLKLSERNRQVSLQRVRKLLPILDCGKNLQGKQPTARPTSEQRAFVEKYRRGELSATPTARDVAEFQRTEGKSGKAPPRDPGLNP